MPGNDTTASRGTGDQESIRDVDPQRLHEQERTIRTSRVTSCLAALVLLARGRAGADVEGADHLCDRCGGRKRAAIRLRHPGEPLLIDTGNAGAAAVRDAERILAAVKDAGLSRIDRLITTHFHADHVGGIAEVAARIPIAAFIDHGPNVQPGGPNRRRDAAIRGALRKGEAHRGAARRQDTDERARVAYRGIGRGHARHVASRCGPARSVLRRLQEARSQPGVRPARRQHRG